MIDTERNLAALCTQGGPAAEKELYLRYAAKIHAVCRRYSDSADDALDLMHDAFIKAYDKLPGFRYSGEGSLYAWLRRLTVNLALDRLRRKRLRLVPLDERGVDAAPDPPDEAMAALPLEKMLDLVASLPPERKAVFNLYCLDGWSHREIADRLGITEKGSASLLAQARKQLKEKIKDYLATHER